MEVPQCVYRGSSPVVPRVVTSIGDGEKSVLWIRRNSGRDTEDNDVLILSLAVLVVSIPSVGKGSFDGIGSLSVQAVIIPATDLRAADPEMLIIRYSRGGDDLSGD